MEVPLELVRKNSQLVMVIDVVASLAFDVGGLITKQMDALLLKKKTN